MKKLGDDDILKLTEVMSEELNRTDSDESVRLTAQMFPLDLWQHLDESARLRSENKFLKSIKEGEYIAASQKCIKGALGTWCSGLIITSLMKDDFIGTFLSKLSSSNKAEQDYVLQFFSSTLLYSLDTMADTFYSSWAIEIIDQNLKAGDKRFHQLANSAIVAHKELWKDSLKESFDSFQEAELTSDDTKD